MIRIIIFNKLMGSSGTLNEIAKVHMMSPAPTKHTSFRLNCKGYGSVFCFLSPFSPDVLVVAVNTIRSLIVFRAKIGQIPPLRENRYPEH